MNDEIVAPAAVGLDPDRIDRARAIVRDQAESGRAVGIVAVVRRHGRLVLAEAHGARNPAGDPMELDTLSWLASATKPITAATVMSLVEDGLIGLNQRVADYFPELPQGRHELLLVHHLLTHTGALRTFDWTGELVTRVREPKPDDERWGRNPVTNAYLSLFVESESEGTPGTKMAYSSVHYSLLGEIIRRVTGQTVGQAMRERILGPLGMIDTSMTASGGDTGRLVERTPGLPFDSAWSESLIGVPTEQVLGFDLPWGGLTGTAPDYLRFCEMIRGGGELDGVRVLSPASVRAMTTNQIPGVPALIHGHAEASWGYGFSIIGYQRWPYFVGGLVPNGSASHGGAGGIDHWIDFENAISGAVFETITETSPMLEPVSGIGHRFEDVITAAVLD